MRNRTTLTREQAIEEYLVCQKRIYESLHIFQIIDEIDRGKYQPHNELGHAPGEFIGSLRTALTGLFASLMDQHSKAINVFDAWLVLFPEKKDRIKKTWKKIQPQIDLIQDYRNRIAFHANKDIGLYFETYYVFRNLSKKISRAMERFWKLAAELQKYQQTALPNLRTESEPALKKIEVAREVAREVAKARRNKKTLSQTELEQLRQSIRTELERNKTSNQAELEQLKDYFIPR